jgi:death-on-curing protein
MRPQLGYYDTLIAEAAGLMESLANYHPFLDGNKRVAIFGTDTFLRINGHFINCDHEKAYAYFMELFDSNRFQFAELEEWLESHTQAL